MSARASARRRGVLQPSRESPAQPQPASRRELIALGVYFTAVVALTDVLNVRLGVELLSLTVLTAALTMSRLPDSSFATGGSFFSGLSCGT